MRLSIRGSTTIVQQASSTTFSVQRTPRPADSPALDTAVTLAQMFGQVGTLVPIPAVSAAATALISVLDAYTRVQANRDRCFRLAERAFTILCQLEEAMEDKWDDAPPALLNNVVKFENVLLSLRDAMKQIASASVTRRILSGSKFSGLLDDHERRLQDMQVSFQLLSMVTVQYALHAQSGQLSDIQRAVLSSQTNNSSMSKDSYGFRRYHQSAVQLQRTDNKTLGWFSGITEGIVDGQKVLVKTYHGQHNAARNLWAEEVKILQHCFHANLPQLVGYSDEETPNPFILLSNVKTHEYTSYMHHIARIEKTDLGVGKLVKAATDIHSAASYIIEHLALNKGQICLFIQNSTFVVDNNDFKVVVGLPSKEVQMRPVTMMGVGLPNESWNRDLTLLIVDRTYYALQDATSTVGSYYYMSTRLHAIVTRAVSHNVLCTYPPISWHGTTPYEFLMELPVQSNLGDVGYVTATSPVFCQLFNAFDRDTTADYSARMVMTYSRNGFELDDMCAPIFNEGPPQEMYYIEADRQFMGTIQISPPVSGTTRRLLSLVYQSYACTDNINNANSIWTGCEPVGVKLYPLKVCGVAFVDTYWLDCSVTNSQESTPSATVDSEEVETQELKFDCIVEVDLITSFRQVQLVGLANANWSSKYHMSLTLLKTRGPRYAVLPMTT